MYIFLSPHIRIAFKRLCCYCICSCIYEIVILNYFLKVTGKDVVFVSPDGGTITAMEGYSIHTAGALIQINPSDVELLIVPGGDITPIDK